MVLWRARLFLFAYLRHRSTLLEEIQILSLLYGTHIHWLIQSLTLNAYQGYARCEELQEQIHCTLTYNYYQACRVGSFIGPCTK